MKIIALTLFLFANLFALAQEPVTKYYDWNWKSCDVSMARFISQVTKTDSGWVRRDFYLSTKALQMKGLYKDSDCKIKNGWFRYYYVNEKLSSYGLYVNDKKDGLWLSYHNNGMMKDSIIFDLGYVQSGMGWYNNGYISDSTVYTNDGYSVQVHWFNDGVPSFAGRFLKGEKAGKWQYFHSNGKLAALEEYEQDKLKSRIYYDEEGKQLADTTNRDNDAEFKGGIKKWHAYLLGNLEFPRGVKILNSDMITVVIAATINEDGKLTDAYVDVPFNKLFDEEALRVMKRSPKWAPAISHNRKVKQYIRQPVSFSQVE